jgi:ArsR family transcriptional regulator
MGNPDRLLLLCQMMEIERNVSELEMLTGVSQPTLSQQLAILRTESLVHTRRDGKNIYYTLANPKVSELMHALYQIFCQPVQERKK